MPLHPKLVLSICQIKIRKGRMRVPMSPIIWMQLKPRMKISRTSPYLSGPMRKKLNRSGNSRSDCSCCSGSCRKRRNLSCRSRNREGVRFLHLRWRRGQCLRIRRTSCKTRSSLKLQRRRLSTRIRFRFLLAIPIHARWSRKIYRTILPSTWLPRYRFRRRSGRQLNL